MNEDCYILIEHDGLIRCQGPGTIEEFAEKLVNEVCPELNWSGIVKYNGYEFKIRRDSTINSIIQTYKKKQEERRIINEEL